MGWIGSLVIFAIGLVGGSSFIYSGWSILENKNCHSVTWGVENSQYFNYHCFSSNVGEMGKTSAGLLALICGSVFLFFSAFPLYNQVREKKRNS